MRKLLFLIVLLLLPMFVMALNPKKVAVYVTGEDASINRVLESKLVSAISRSAEFTAIERTAAFLAELSKEQGYQRTGAVDASELSRLGKQFGVQYVCVANVSNVFGDKFISARLIDVETAEIVKSHDVGGEMNNMSDCLRLANEIATNLSKGTFAEQSEEARIRAAEEARRKAEYERIAAEHRAQLKAEGYVDLGLPSGTLWRAPQKMHVKRTWDEAGDKMPSREHWEELIRCCKWTWNGSGYNVTGSNGNSIVLHANGFYDCDGKSIGMLDFGCYWSSTPGDSRSACALVFDSDGVEMRFLLRCGRLSVCRVQNP